MLESSTKYRFLKVKKLLIAISLNTKYNNKAFLIIEEKKRINELRMPNYDKDFRIIEFYSKN